MSDAKKNQKDESKPADTKPAEPSSVAIHVRPDGETVAVIPVGETIIYPDSGEERTDLALVESPDKHYESKVLFSKKKEPGTWHYQ